MNLYYLKTKEEPYELYERIWLEDIFQKKIILKPFETELIPNDSWVIVQRPYSSILNTYFEKLNNANISFKVIHLSDEFCSDCIDFYKLPNCKAVIRNYLREDTPDLPHILTIPLGYHHKTMSDTKTFDERKLVWSFHGTNWFGRQEALSPWMNITPNNCVLTPDWNHPSMVKEHDYVQTLSNSKFIPILRGNNPETFRVYEALEAGCIPICVINEDHIFYQWLFTHVRIPICKQDDVITVLNSIQEIEEREEFRKVLNQQWSQYKRNVKERIQKLL